VTAGIGIASVDGSRPRRSLRPVAGLERLLGSGRVEPVAGGLGPKLNIEPIITLSCRGHDRPGVAGHRPEARIGARLWVIAAHTGIRASGLVSPRIANGTNACRMCYD